MSKRFLTNINAITASLTGQVTASAFAGDGSLLTNIPAGTIANNSLSPAVLTASTITIGSTVVGLGQTITNISTSGTGSFSGRVTASAFAGNGNLLSNLNGASVINNSISPAALTASAITIGSTAVGLGTTLTNISTSGTGSFSGRVTASAFAGDGSLLTNLPAPVIANNSLSPAVLTASTITIGSTVIGLGGTLTNISTSGTGSFSGRVTASAFSGDGNLISNINGTSIVNNSIAPAALTASTITIGSTAVGLGGTLTNISTSGTGSFSGRVTASAFAGDGSLITGITVPAGTTTTAASGMGYIGMPQNSQSVDYTVSASDAGKHIYNTVTGKTITIPANSASPFPIGMTVVLINDVTASCLIAITTDTLRLANSTSTGTRTLGLGGMATIVKVGSASWVASGNGLS